MAELEQLLVSRLAGCWRAATAGGGAQPAAAPAGGFLPGVPLGCCLGMWDLDHG
jgi:hypothetical protein